MTSRSLETARGASVHVREAGPADGQPVVFLHGVAGPLEQATFLERLAERYRVYAPELPGYGESTGEEQFEEMLDFTLHGWDVITALGLSGRRPALIGHSLGGMIAAEMAAIQPEGLSKLVLVDALGLWMDDCPIPDLFAFLPFEFADYLFSDPSQGEAVLSGGTDMSDPAAMQDFVVANSRRLGTASKMLFPVPNRRLSKRLYRLSTETLVVWGEDDRLVPPAYASRWAELLPTASVRFIAGAGHMAPYEQPHPLAREVTGFIG